MPMKKTMPRKKRFTRKPYNKKRRAYRKRNPNNVVGGPNTCKVIETVPAQVVNLNTPYDFIKAGITGARASAIAKEFGLYRIALLKYTYRPLFDTYSSSLPGVGNSPNSLPTLYWKINRYGDTPAAFAGDYMRSLGCKPIRLDDKNVVIRYKPNTLQLQQDAAGTSAASIKITPWLSTDENPGDFNFVLSTAQHYGHSLFIEGGGAGTGLGAAAIVDLQIVYEFKNPRQVVADPDMTKIGTPQKLKL